MPSSGKSEPARARSAKVKPSGPRRRQAPGKSLEARENQLINLAAGLAEKQIRAGTASSQVITHFLKLGSTQERLEREKLEKENELLRAKTEALKSAKKVEALYSNALKAMRSYSGQDDTEGGDVTSEEEADDDD